MEYKREVSCYKEVCSVLCEHQVCLLNIYFQYWYCLLKIVGMYTWSALHLKSMLLLWPHAVYWFCYYFLYCLCSVSAVKRLVFGIKAVIISYFGCGCACDLHSFVWPPWKLYFRQSIWVVILFFMSWIGFEKRFAALQHILWHSIENYSIAEEPLVGETCSVQLYYIFVKETSKFHTNIYPAMFCCESQVGYFDNFMYEL